MAWDNAVVTNNGVAMLQQVLAGEVLTLDWAAGGTGTVPPSSLMAQTALKEQKQNFAITGAANVPNGKKISVQITNVGLMAGYLLQQVGIWAHVGNSPPVLFAILQDNTGIAIPSDSEVPDFAMNFYAVIDFSNESNFNLVVDPSALVTLGELNEKLANLETKEGAQAKANTAEANAKAYTDAHEQKAAPHSGHETPAGAQAKAEAAEANAKAYTDQEVAEVSQALAAHLAETVIKQNLTINVPADYLTIQAALDALKYAWIPRDVTVTIQVAAGTYTHTSPIVVDHPCGSQIRIIGATPITTTITGAGTVSGSAGNWSVPITVADVTGIQVGQYAIIRNTSGTGDHFAHRGIWEITAVDAATKTVTVKNTHKGSTFLVATLSGGDFIVLTTILKFNSCHGFYFYGNNFGLLDNVAIVGSSTSEYDGICLTSYFSEDTLRGANVKLGNNVGVAKFNAGIRVYSGSLIAENVASSSNFREGFLAIEGGTINAPSSTASGNGGNGFYASLSGSIDVSASTASGNGSDGFYASYSGSIYAPSSTAIGNGSSGFSAEHSGSIDASASTASGNGTDYRAQRMGYIYCADYAGTPTFSPAVNTEGNYNAIITT